MTNAYWRNASIAKCSLQFAMRMRSAYEECVLEESVHCNVFIAKRSLQSVNCKAFIAMRMRSAYEELYWRKAFIASLQQYDG